MDVDDSQQDSHDPMDSQVPVDIDAEPETNQQDVDPEQLQRASTILEAMLTAMPVNRYTRAVRADIDWCKLECVLLLSILTEDTQTAPESTTLPGTTCHDLPYRYNVWLQAFNEVDRVYTTIMTTGASLKRTASDPPEPERSKPRFQVTGTCADMTEPAADMTQPADMTEPADDMTERADDMTEGCDAFNDTQT